MARTKQTARKQEKPGRSRAVVSSSSEGETSSGGLPRANFPAPTRQSPRKRAASSAGVGGVSKRIRTMATSTGFTSSEDSQEFFSSHEDPVLSVAGGRTDGGASLGADPAIGKQPRQPIASKNLKRVRQINTLVRGRPRGKGGFREIARWNRDGRQKRNNETQRGWMKKAVKTKDAQGRVLRKCHPGTVALREIRFYQRSRVFLIPMLAFQRVVQEICIDVAKAYRWQAIALYNLQVAAEAFLVGYLGDTNLCALHRKCMTIFPKDLFLARHRRGKSNTGWGGSSRADQEV